MYNKAQIRLKVSRCCSQALFTTLAVKLLFLLAWIAGCTVALADAKVLSKAEENQLYDEAVHILGGNANVISRWIDPVQLAIIGSPSTQSETYAQTIMREISVQTRLGWSLVGHEVHDADVYYTRLETTEDLDLSVCNSSDAGECANLVVLFASPGNIKRIAAALPLRQVYRRSLEKSEAVPCFFAPFQTSGQIIRKAFVYVNNNLSQAMQNTCLQEEIYQAFGLFNDYTNSTFFSFNNRVEPKSITDYDRALLASVYDPTLKPGAPVFAVMERLMNRLSINPFEK